MKNAQALVIVTPEYNGLFTPLLKNTLDWMSGKTDNQTGAAVFRGKPVLGWGIKIAWRLVQVSDAR